MALRDTPGANPSGGSAFANPSAGEAAGAAAFGNAGASAAGGSAFALTQKGTVFFGASGALRYNERGYPTGQTSETWMTPEDAYGDFYHWGTKQRQDLTSAGIVAGQLKVGDGDIETAAWWKSLVQEAAKYGAAGQKISPMDIASGYVSAAGQGLTDKQRSKLQRGSFPSGAMFDENGKYTGSYREGEFIVNTETGQRQYVGARFKTTTGTHVDISDPETAKAVTTSLFQQLLGRDPQSGELATFANSLNQAEQASPAHTTTTSEYNDLGDVVNQSTKTEGGLDATAKQQLLADKAKSTKEYGVYQAATTYSNATKKAIWGGPGA